MALNLNLESFRTTPALAAGVEGKRVLITGAGRGLGRAFALAAGLNRAASVGVHFHSSYSDALETVEAINRAGGTAFPVQADVTNTSDIWATRTYVINKMGGKPPNLLICNSGLSERGYLLGMPLKAVEGEAPAMRRARARQAFVANLADSHAVLATKIDGFLFLTHLWAGEALHAGEKLQIVYVSSRQATDPGGGVPGYVLANFGVLALPRILRVNLGKRADLVRAFSVAYPFVRTGMTEAYVENAKVFGRWQPRMLTSREAAHALLQLLTRPDAELDDRVYQLNAEKSEAGIALTWSGVELRPSLQSLDWSVAAPMTLAEKAADNE
jgi:NAD(P)-dependent dehydrogenase (short-subunit alcohol dehydrogenase family)